MSKFAVEDVTTSWLQSTVPGFADTTVEDIATLTGGYLGQVLLVATGDGRRLVVKLPPTNEEAAAVVDKVHAFEREALCYDEVLPLVPIDRRLASGVKALHSQLTDGGVLVLSHFPGRPPEPPYVSLTEAKAATALSMLADFAGVGVSGGEAWAPLRPKLEALSAGTAEFVTSWFDGYKAAFLSEVYGDEVDSAGAEYVRGLTRADVVAALTGPEEGPVMSCLHGDCWSGNWLLSSDGGLALIDFQFAGLGPVVFDVALVLFFATEDLDDAGERRLVAHYTAALAAASARPVPDLWPSFDTIGRRFALAWLLASFGSVQDGYDTAGDGGALKAAILARSKRLVAACMRQATK